MELPKKQLPWSLPRYYEPIGTFSCENSPFLGGTRGIVLLSSQVWKDVNSWALEIGISCTYSNPVITRGRKHTQYKKSSQCETSDCLSLTNTGASTNKKVLVFVKDNVEYDIILGTNFLSKTGIKLNYSVGNME